MFLTHVQLPAVPWKGILFHYDDIANGQVSSRMVSLSTLLEAQKEFLPPVAAAPELIRQVLDSSPPFS